jgi:hypothetical protein
MLGGARHFFETADVYVIFNSKERNSLISAVLQPLMKKREAGGLGECLLRPKSDLYFCFTPDALECHIQI